GRRSISQALKLSRQALGSPGTNLNPAILSLPNSPLATSEPAEIKSHKNQENPTQRVNTGKWL
ncbi:hypothetical protein, partial [Pseudomonas sp. NBRC 111130]|uniref:hypothetical protein n=1 Tax=Pseudomonas sp. NBRC 111130 TaxID=1661045 RepID=UPI001C43B031